MLSNLGKPKILSSGKGLNICYDGMAKDNYILGQIYLRGEYSVLPVWTGYFALLT